jgi:hypothetical protein
MQLFLESADTLKSLDSVISYVCLLEVFVAASPTSFYF